MNPVVVGKFAADPHPSRNPPMPVAAVVNVFGPIVSSGDVLSPRKIRASSDPVVPTMVVWVSSRYHVAAESTCAPVASVVDDPDRVRITFEVSTHVTRAKSTDA